MHPQNTMQFAYELQKAQLPFEMMLYPRSRHGVTEPALLAHLSALKLAFVERTLLSQGGHSHFISTGVRDPP